MEFVSEYYLWFVIGGIILIMALIGYIADKTDFGHKDIRTSQTKGKEDKKDAEISETVETNSNNTEDISPEIKEEISTIEEPTIEEKENLETKDDKTMDFDNQSNNINEIDPFVMPSIEEPLIENNDANNDEEIEIKEVTDDSIFALNNDLSPFAATEIVNPIGSADSVDNEVSEVIGEDIPVQSMMTNNSVDEVINSSIDNQDNDDDIWKF